MIRRSVRLGLLFAALLALPFSSPAPLIYRPGEGWTYEVPGDETSGKWRKTRAKDQLEATRAAFEAGNYRTAAKSGRRLVKTWPLSDYAPEGQYFIGRAYEARKMDERAFKEYQTALTKYPKVKNHEEILQRQFEIANRYLGGQWFKLWGYIPFFPNMEKTSEMYNRVVANGPYSAIAPQAQMNLGAAREKQKEFPLAVRAYERAADRYADQPIVSAEALYKAGMAYYKQAKTADYDQSISQQAIATFEDFMTLFPKDARVPETQKLIAELKVEQARGAFNVAKFYEKDRIWDGALVYYNEVLLKDPSSKLATSARERIEILKSRRQAAEARQAAKKPAAEATEKK